MVNRDGLAALNGEMLQCRCRLTRTFEEVGDDQVKMQGRIFVVTASL